MKISKNLFLAFFAFVFTPVSFTPVWAQAFDAERIEDAEPDEHNTTFTLIAEGDTFKPGEIIWVAARLEMNPEWHTYWEFTGDSGIPTTIDWTLPEGFEAGDIHWPAPYRFLESGILVTFGYKDVVHLMVPIQTPADLEPGTTHTFSAFAEWLECKEICLQGEGRDSLTLTAGESPPNNPLFEEVFRSIPSDFDGAFTAGFTRDASQLTLTLKLDDASELRPGELSFFPKNALLWNFLEGFDIERDGQFIRITGTLVERPEIPAVLEGILVHESGMLTENGPRTLNIRAQEGPPAAYVSQEQTPSEDPAVYRDAEEPRNLFSVLLIAFIAGIGINLLPCVFPVLGLKISGFMEQAQGSARAMKIHALVFALGILVSLWIVAAIVGALGAAWGAQFQEPRLNIALILILTFFTLNLYGLFEIGTSLTTVGGSLSQKEGYGGSFFQGILMTVIATPCTGPILAGIIGWMLGQPAWVGFLTFTAMGIGIGLPYVVLAFVPKLTEKLPPPGMWMVTLKQGAAFAMLVFIWIVFHVLSRQLTPGSTMRVLGATLFVCFAAWVLGKWGDPARKPAVRKVGHIATLLLLAFATWLAYSYQEPAAILDEALAARVAEGDPIRYEALTPELAAQLLADEVPLQFRPFSPELLAQLRAEGTPVFVDFTAEWCTICKINKYRVLHRPEVLRAFQEKGVVTLRADFTSYDPVIGETLAYYGRRGLPVYLFYGPGPNAEAQFLPEQLNTGLVLEFLDEM